MILLMGFRLVPSLIETWKRVLDFGDSDPLILKGMMDNLTTAEEKTRGKKNLIPQRDIEKLKGRSE